MAVQREKVIRTAEKHVAKGRIDAAIREYRKVLSEHPGDVSTLNRLGDLYARNQHFDEAVEVFERIASGYTDDGFFVKAIAIYKKIIKLDPTRLEVYERLAELYHKQGLINEARTQYQVLADYYTKHDNQASAIAIYQKMAELEPDNPSHHAKLAELFIEEKLLDKAMAEYRTIAELMIDHGSIDQAFQVYQKALDVDESDIGFITAAVMKLKDAGHTGQAARFLTLAVERNPAAEKVAELAGLEEGEPASTDGAEAVPAEETPAPEATSEPTAAEEPALEAAETVPAEEAQPEAAGVPSGEEGEAVVLDLDTDGAELETALQEAAEQVDSETAPDGEAAPRAGEEIELDLDEVEELSLDLEEEAPASMVQPPEDMADGEPGAAFRTGEDEAAAPELAAEPAAEESSVEVDADFLERTAAELHPPEQAGERDQDMVAEAEVLAKYGMPDKAAERLEEALEANPRSLEAHALLVRVELDRKRHGRAAELGRAMAEIVGSGADGHGLWEETRGRLEQAGFQIEGTRIEAPEAPPSGAEGTTPEPSTAPPPAAETASRPSRRGSSTRKVDEMIKGLLGQAGAGKRKRRPEPKAASEGGAQEPAPPPGESAPPVPPSGEQLPGAEDITLHGIFDEVELDEPAGFEPAVPPEPADAGSRPVPEDMSWLDEEREVTAGGGTEIFSDEDDFFDLAAELEQELSEEEALGGEPVMPQEQTLEEIVEGFKKGVAENLSAEDYDTHFNLGIAYREMGLLDEAIGEFQVAAKGGNHLVECCSMLGLSFVEKGLPELAVKWYQRGLDAPEVSEEKTMGLLYDLGNAYMAMDASDKAREIFVELYGINSHYRDVVAKLEELP